MSSAMNLISTSCSSVKSKKKSVQVKKVENVAISAFLIKRNVELFVTWWFLLFTNIAMLTKAEVSYVIEPFEAMSDNWYESVYNDIGILNISLTNEEDALFGDHALQIHYEVEQTETWGGFVSFGYLLNVSDAPYNCLGGDYLSLWYKIVQPQSTPGRTHVRLVLMDDSDCIGETCDDPPGLGTEFYVSFHYILDGVNETGTGWTEIRVELKGDGNSDSPFWRPGWAGIVGNDVLDLDHLRGWFIEISIDSQAGIGNKSEGVLLIDQLACVGGGDLFGAAFRVKDSFENLTESGVWTEEYYESSLSENRSQEVLEKGMLYLNYTIEQVETWGGFISYEHLAPGPSYYNLSEATDVLLIYSVMVAAKPAGLANFELSLMDGRFCKSNCNDNANLEKLNSFFYILDNVSPGVIQMNIGDDKIIDASEIKGFRLQLNMGGNNNVGSLVSGFVTVGNMTAVMPSLIVPIFNDSENNIKKCVNEPDLAYHVERGSSEFQRVEFLSSKCCETCEMDASCLYAQSDDRDCFLSSSVNPSSVELANTDFKQTRFTSFWMDDPMKRGDFCDVCECNATTSSIDCRGKELEIIPKTFSESWSPVMLDLRDNPELGLIGSGSLASISNDLKELKLPSNLRFMAFESVENLQNLDFVDFENGKSQVSNVITHVNNSFGDICCGLGKEINLLIPEHGLTFCDMNVDTPGVDTVMEPFVEYYDADVLEIILPSSDFMSEASASPEKCAEYCTIVDDCMYFSYSARWKEAEHRCYLLADNGTRDVVCCEPDDYADMKGTMPGWTSGKSPRARRELDNAKVLSTVTDNVLSENNGYKTEFVFSLGSTPLRGAVWVEPELVSNTNLSVLFMPQRVVLYDENKTATIEVTVLNAKEILTNQGSLIVVENSVQSCDIAFAMTSNDETNDIFLMINPADELHQLGYTRIIGYFFILIIIFTALGFCKWTKTNRTVPVVKASQPHFLYMLCVGVIVLGLTIIPLSIDDEIASVKVCSAACILMPWLFFMGFCICFSALFSKLLRINKIVAGAVRFRRVVVTERDVLYPFVAVFTLNFLFLLLWSILDPLLWVRAPVNKNASDSLWNTFGQCVSSEKGAAFWVSIVGLCSIYIDSLTFACYQAYKARNVSDDFSESKHIGTIFFSWLQLSIVGIPILVLVRTNPVALYFLEICLIFVSCMSLLLFIFIPKLLIKKDNTFRGVITASTRPTVVRGHSSSN